MKLALRLGLCALVLVVASCAANYETLDRPTERALFQDFEAGAAKLDCGISCSGRWGANRRKAKALHDAEAWKDLAILVMRIGRDNDLAWFYLGRSAEGEGHLEAAQRYYRLSIAASKMSNRCGGLLFNNCDGFTFPDDVNRRLAGIQQTLARKATPAIEKNYQAGFTRVRDSQSGPDSPSALRDAVDLGAMVEIRPANERPMYGLVHERRPRNEAERKYISNLKKADKRLFEAISRKGLTRKQGSKAFVRVAWTKFRTGDYATAMKRFNQAWLLDPENGDAYYGFALIVAMRKGYPAQIETYFLMAISKPSFSVAAQVDYGRFLWTQKRLDESLEQLSLALDKDPKAYNARNHIAFVYYLKKNYAEACRWGRLAEKNGDRLETGFVDDMCSRR